MRGCTRYHLGRSTADSGAEDFKKKWNATASQLYWYFHRPSGGEMPQLNVDNPKYKLAIQALAKAAAVGDAPDRAAAGSIHSVSSHRHGIRRTGGYADLSADLRREPGERMDVVGRDPARRRAWRRMPDIVGIGWSYRRAAPRWCSRCKRCAM